jgi:hypothetical protein
MKPWLKRAGMKFVQPGVKSAAMEAGDAGAKSDAGGIGSFDEIRLQPY